jgi:hypothetical protein
MKQVPYPLKKKMFLTLDQFKNSIVIFLAWEHSRYVTVNSTTNFSLFEQQGSRGQEATQQPASADKRHESKDGDSAEKEPMIA